MANIAAFNFTQALPETIWVVNHNLNNTVVCDVVLSTGEKILPVDVVKFDNNTIHIIFSVPRTGSVRVMAII